MLSRLIDGVKVSNWYWVPKTVLQRFRLCLLTSSSGLFMRLGFVEVMKLEYDG